MWMVGLSFRNELSLVGIPKNVKGKWFTVYTVVNFYVIFIIMCSV